MSEADYRLMTDTTGGRIATALEELIPLQAPNYVATITSGQWSGSEGDYYITVSASNVTANSILIPHYDGSSIEFLKGPVWCVPNAGSFTIHTSALPSGTVSVLVQFIGVMGEAQYQVLADVYSTSQTYSKSEAVAKADIINNLTSTATDKPLSAAMGKTLNDKFSNLVITDTIAMDFSTLTTVTEDVPQHTGYKPLCVVGIAFSGGYNPAQVTTAFITDTQVRCCSSNTTSTNCTVRIAYIRNQ